MTRWSDLVSPKQSIQVHTVRNSGVYGIRNSGVYSIRHSGVHGIHNSGMFISTLMSLASLVRQEISLFNVLNAQLFN